MPGWYDRQVLPWLIDVACGLAPVTRRRRDVVPLAHGRVVEIGIGTGRNLAHYNRDAVTEIIGIDPATEMHARVRERNAAAGLPLRIEALSAERLPLADASCDSAVCTYTLCSVPDPQAALAELHRVLKPGGPLLLAEHGLAPDADVARWQRRLEPMWRRIAGGCHLARDMPQLLQRAGFHADLRTRYLARPHFLTYTYWGVARRD